MNTRRSISKASRGRSAPLVTDLLLLPDGRVLVHGLTPAFERFLHDLELGGCATGSRDSVQLWHSSGAGS